MSPTKHEEYLAAREKWVHEDNLLNHRLSWLLLSQTILFATYAVLLSASDSAQIDRIHKLLSILPWIGIANIVFAYISIWAAILAQQDLKESIKQKFEITLLGRTTFLVGHSAAIALPLVFLIHAVR